MRAAPWPPAPKTQRARETTERAPPPPPPLLLVPRAASVYRPAVWLGHFFFSFFFFFLGVLRMHCTDKMVGLVRPPDPVWDSYPLVAPIH